MTVPDHRFRPNPIRPEPSIPMTDLPPTLATAAPRAGDRMTAQDREAWRLRIDRAGDEAGYFQTLGDRHFAFFSDEGSTLLVTFESAASIRARGDGLPAGLEIAGARGWSHLCLIAEGDTWYRDAAVYRYMDRLVDDAFFEDFDRVVFYGAGMGGYAAAAYSVAAPGSTVVALRPVATLNPALAGWDTRFVSARRLCFTDRYGFAPDMTEGAGQVFVVFDPEVEADAMHAALFAKPHVTFLRCRHFGARLETGLAEMGLLGPLLVAAGDGRLDAAAFHRLFRLRRGHVPYLREVMGELDASDRPMLAGLLARNAAARLGDPVFARRLERLAAQGVTLPPKRR
jgi:hypothetical protein